MTAGEARTFDRYSVANAVQVKRSLECGCQPYQDVFTYRRWQGQGFQVQRGEKAIKLPTIQQVEHQDQDTGEVTLRKLFGTASVFCRHQVASLQQGTPAPEPAWDGLLPGAGGSARQSHRRKSCTQ